MPRFSLLLPLKARDPSEGHRAATQLKLFFDLINVIAIASITAGLHHAISEGHGLDKLPAFIFIFVAIWWAWMNFTWFASAFDNDGPIYRLLVMLIMGGELVFAGGAARIMETMDFGWGLWGWCIMRLGMAALWFRAAANPQYRATTLRYGYGILFAQACWIAFYFIFSPQDILLFYAAGIVCFLIEFSVPMIAEKAGTTPFHRHHMIERYGLLTIISLGEIMLAISLGFGFLYAEHPGWAAARTAVAALFIVFSLFWVYFDEKEHLPSREFNTVFTWGYGHVFIFGAIAVLGAGIAAELDIASHHSHVSQADVAWWLGVPMAVFFTALAVVRDRHFRLGINSLALPTMAVLSLLTAYLGLSSWAFALIAAIAVLWRVPVQEATRQEVIDGNGVAPMRSGFYT